MTIYSIKPEIKNHKPTDVPPLPRQGRTKTIYGFHLTPVHPRDKGFFGLIISHKVLYNNGGQEEISGQVYFNYENDGQKPTMREVFTLASVAQVIFDSLIKQQLGNDIPSLEILIQKEHVESINKAITQAYPLN